MNCFYKLWRLAAPIDYMWRSVSRSSLILMLWAHSFLKLSSAEC
jgi:hypothetical protein